MTRNSLPVVVFVGGFLGAGKTTLLLRAAGLLRDRGIKVGLLMNDQDDHLVDTQFARAKSYQVNEVGGGCFCCRFSHMEEKLTLLVRTGAEVILAEPVGSCIDLVRTLFEPLRSHYSHRYRLAPLTVLVDPRVLLSYGAMTGATGTSCVAPEADPNDDIRYLFKHQIQEADLLCTSKHDLYGELACPEVPFDFHLSAVTGHDLEAWLNEVLGGTRAAGVHPLELDYDRYAQAEAALAWLNLHMQVTTSQRVMALSLVGPFIERLQQQMSLAGLGIAHLKVFASNGSEAVKVSVCANCQIPDVTGTRLSEPATHHQVALNIRATGVPELLEQLAIGEVSMWATEQDAHVEMTHFRCFRPPPPRPEHLRTSTSGHADATRI